MEEYNLVIDACNKALNLPDSVYESYYNEVADKFPRQSFTESGATYKIYEIVEKEYGDLIQCIDGAVQYYNELAKDNIAAQSFIDQLRSYKAKYFHIVGRILTNLADKEPAEGYGEEIYKRAIENHKIAVELEPKNAEYHYRIGEVYSKLGSDKGTMLSCLKALKYNDQHPEANIKLAVALSGQRLGTTLEEEDVPQILEAFGESIDHSKEDTDAIIDAIFDRKMLQYGIRSIRYNKQKNEYKYNIDDIQILEMLKEVLGSTKDNKTANYFLKNCSEEYIGLFGDDRPEIAEALCEHEQNAAKNAINYDAKDFI